MWYLQVLGVLEEVAGNHSPGGHGGFGRALPRREGAPKDHLVLASTTGSTMCQRGLVGWAAAHGRGDRCLVFCQTRQMLDIVQGFVRASGYTYCRLDGTTQVAP